MYWSILYPETTATRRTRHTAGAGEAQHNFKPYLMWYGRTRISSALSISCSADQSSQLSHFTFQLMEVSHILEFTTQTPATCHWRASPLSSHSCEPRGEGDCPSSQPPCLLPPPRRPTVAPQHTPPPPAPPPPQAPLAARTLEPAPLRRSLHLSATLCRSLYLCHSLCHSLPTAALCRSAALPRTPSSRPVHA